MSSNGRTRLVTRWPTGHSGWCYSGLTELEGSIASFLAEGADRGERVMFVSDDPHPCAWPAALIERGDLVIASTCETYGDKRVVDVASARARFEALVAEAVRAGYAGLRIAADNTSLIAGPDRLAAWMEWEKEADLFIRANPITGLCAFDRTRADAAFLSVVMGAHAVHATYA